MVETYEGTPKKYYVEYARLKWGTGKNPLFGSEHTVQGRRRNLEVCFHYYKTIFEICANCSEQRVKAPQNFTRLIINLKLVC